MKAKEKHILPFLQAALRAVVFLFVLELAAGASFYLLELALVCYGAAMLLVLLKMFSAGPQALLQNFGGKIKENSGAFGFLAAYILWDLFTLSYSPAAEHFWPKYKVIAMMIAVTASFFLINWQRADIKKIFWSVGSAGIVTVFLTILNYTVLPLFPLYYTRRLSLRSDYNMFASVVFFSFLILFFLISAGGGSCRSKVFKICILAAVQLPVLVLSSSRRYFALIFPVSAVLAGDLLWLTKRENGSLWKTSAALAATVAAVAAIAYGYDSYLEQNEEKLLALPQAKWAAQGEALPQERYAAIGKENQGSKRKLIWQISAGELQTFSAKELLVGRGFCYDNYLLRTSRDSRLLQAYPKEMRQVLSAHGFILADLLNGGGIKLVLAAGVWTCIFYRLFFLLKRQPFWGQMYWACFLTVLLNNGISNRYGFLYDKLFWLFFLLILAEKETAGTAILPDPAE